MRSFRWAASLSSPASESSATASDSLFKAAVSLSVRFTAGRFRNLPPYTPIDRNTYGYVGNNHSNAVGPSGMRRIASRLMAARHLRSRLDNRQEIGMQSAAVASHPVSVRL